MSASNVSNLSAILIQEYQKRRKKNPKYSIRSFARDLNVSHRAILDVMNNKRHFSRENLGRVAARLSMPFLEKFPLQTMELSFHQLSEAAKQEMASNWYYCAVHSLARLSHNRAAPEWISRRLRITPTLATKALNCLTRMGLVEIRDGRMLLLKQNFESAPDVPSVAMRKFHKQNLKRAAESIDRDPVSDRDITSITLAFSDKDLKRAKEYIRKFRHRFCKKFEISSGTDVYTLAVQLFPQTARATGSAE